MADEVQWRRVAVHPIGGLTEVGFVPDTSRLLVVSHQGRGEYDLVDGVRVARDDDDDESWFDVSRRACLALVVPAWVPVVGLAGGSLPTRHGRWRLDVRGECVIVLDQDGLSQELIDGEEVRVAGFSPTGDTIVVGRSMDLSIYRAP